MATQKDKVSPVKIEDIRPPSDYEISEVADTYSAFYEYRNQRAGNFKQIQGSSLEDYWAESRQLFWTSIVTESEDLKELDLQFALPFVRKEVLDFLGRITSMGIVPQLSGDTLGQYGVKVLASILKKWRLKSKDKVEKFWETLYGIVNGTVCLYVGFDDAESTKRYLRQFNPKTGEYLTEEKVVKMWNDVRTEVVPLEEMYFSKIWQRNVQLQGRTIRKKEMSVAEFKSLYGKYRNAEFVRPGSMIDAESLYFQLLSGSGVTATDRIQVLDDFDTDNDKRKIIANGILLNGLGGEKVSACSPNPFDHKMQPYVVSVHEPIDEKFIYGLSMPYKLKDPHKILNTSYTMLLERELRLIDPPILTSDFEAPSLVFGQKKVIPVSDVNAYKEIRLDEAGGSFFTMMNSLQGTMSSQAQGGYSQIAPSRQPKSSREIVDLANLRQQALGNALTLYFDMVYQEIILVLKTALQFYQNGKYDEGNLIRTITVPDFPLSQGGIGQLEVRIVKKPQEALALHFESIEKGIKNGKTTEIIEVPVDVLNNLEFFIDDIKLEPEKTTELERSLYAEQVLNPILKVFIPAGVADMGKTFLRFLEKFGEHPANYVSNQNMPGFMSQMSNRMPSQPVQDLQQRGGGQGMTGQMMQMARGQMRGGQSNGGYGEELELS